jgi:hypothetical protein
MSGSASFQSAKKLHRLSHRANIALCLPFSRLDYLWVLAPFPRDLTACSNGISFPLSSM